MVSVNLTLMPALAMYITLAHKVASFVVDQQLSNILGRGIQSTSLEPSYVYKVAVCLFFLHSDKLIISMYNLLKL